MKMVNILVTALGGDIGGNIINILKQEEYTKLFIVGTDIKENVFSTDIIDNYYKIEKTDSPLFYNQLEKIIKDNNIHIIIPVSEKEIIWFNENINLFDKLNVKIIINNEMIIKTFLNKLNTSLELNKMGINSPETYLFSDYKNNIIFPLILKSNYSINDKKYYVIYNETELDYFKNSIKNKHEFIIQKYIGSIKDEYTTAVYKSDEIFETISFKRELSGGMTSFASISDEIILTKYAKKIAEYFDLQGSINIQSRKLGNEFYIFEINPRLSSTIFIRNHFGFQDLLWWINDTLKERVFNISKINISSSGNAILGYKYKFFKDE